MPPGRHLPEIFGFALGATATVAQVVLVREALSLCGGNELALGLGLSLWLVGVALGALAAGWLPRPGSALASTAVAAAPAFGAAWAILRLHRSIVDLPAGGDPSLPAIAALLAVGTGLGGIAVGFLFTVAARAAADGSDRPVSRLYTAEAAGALVGGLAFSLVMAGRISHPAALAIAAGVGALGAGAVLSGASRAAAWAAAALLIVAAAGGPLAALDQWTSTLAFEALDAGELVTSTDSPYGRLAVGRIEDQHQLYSDGRLVRAFPDPWRRSEQIHLAMAQHPDPRRVLLVGGGAPDRIEACLAHGPDRAVLTYLDDAIPDLCGPLWPKETVRAVRDPRVELIRDDGRRFVARTEERFDAVIVAARPPRCAQSNRYHTLEFVEAVRRALAPEGSVTLLAPGGANVLAPEAARAAASAAATVGAVFEHVVLVPGLEISIHASSSKGVVSDDPAVLADRLLSRGARTPSFSPRRFESLLEPGRIARLREQIDAWPGRINTDARPFAYLSNLQLWERSLSGDRGAGGSTWTGAAERWAPAWLAIPLFLWAVWRIPRRARSPSGDAIFSIATTGAAAMAVEIVVLYAFQAASGRVYTGMAAIVGVFMAGLGLGAHLGRRLPRGLSAAGGAVADGAVLALLLASGPALAAAASAAWLAVAWSALAGAVTGAAFPVLIGLAAARRAGDERRLASSFEAADHAGAALGGFATGVIWLPVWGIETTCLLLCGLKVAALAGQILGIRSGRAGR